LVTVALNPAMSNAPWSEGEAQAAGLAKGKRSALAQSVLLLNADLTKRDTIDEQAIAERGQALARRAAEIWPRPLPRQLPGEVGICRRRSHCLTDWRQSPGRVGLG